MSDAPADTVAKTIRDAGHSVQRGTGVDAEARITNRRRSCGGQARRIAAEPSGDVAEQDDGDRGGVREDERTRRRARRLRRRRRGVTDAWGVLLSARSRSPGSKRRKPRESGVLMRREPPVAVPTAPFRTSPRETRSAKSTTASGVVDVLDERGKWVGRGIEGKAVAGGGCQGLVLNG